MSLPSSAARRVAVLLGNPNTGKTTLFNALSGLNHRVGNYPGVTVESKKGHMVCAGQPFELIDLPGTYSLAPRSPDEMVAVDILLGRQEGEARPDVLVCIADASNLERNLYLTTQVLELGVPVVIALNMTDVAASLGIHVDAAVLAERLGVPVIPIQANRKKGLDELRQAIARAAGGPLPGKHPTFPAAFEREADELVRLAGSDSPVYLARRALLDIGGWSETRLVGRLGGGAAERIAAARQRLAAAGCPVPAVEARSRYGWIRESLAGCVHRPAHRPVTWTDRLDRLLTHRLAGTLVFLVVMFLLFQSIFTAAKPFMSAIDAGRERVAGLVSDRLPPGPFTSLLVEGVLGGVGAVVIFLPQILILFAFIAILEDCGYMARAAFLMDRLMSRCGLSGKSFIPLLSSIACAVPGIMATRVIEDRRDRLATIVVAPLMSCSARLPVYILLIGAFLTDGYPFWLPGLVMFALYALGLVLAPLVALVLKRTLLRGQTPVFVMEMPPYKWPSLTAVLRRMFDSGWAFLRRAGTIILASMVLVWVLLNFPAGDYPERVAALNASVTEVRKEADGLRESIAEPIREIRRLARQERRAAGTPAHDAILTRREELLASLAPVRQQLDPLEAQLAPVDEEINRLEEEWKRQSYLGRVGQAIEPLVRPLGWDWRIGVAALASFPAREVVVSTLGIIYQQGSGSADELGDVAEYAEVAETGLGKALLAARFDDDPARRVFTVPTALSLMVFFALCCQCASTLAVIRRETRSWSWPVFTFGYMTGLAYLGALLVYQIGSRIGG